MEKAIGFAEAEIKAEVWMPVNVDGFSELYEVSNIGRVRRTTTSSYRGAWKAGRFLALSPRNDYGHIKVELWNRGKRKSMWLQRLVLLTFIGEPPNNYYEAAHIDGNTSNNRLSNLRWATSKENTEDCRKHGTMVVGSNSVHAKLHESDIPNIFRFRGEGMTQKEIGDIYGVHRVTIKKILQRRLWKHVEMACC